jgi:replicative DNA helicase Mcm
MAKQVSHEEVFTRFIEDFRTDEGVLKYEQTIQEMPIKGVRSLIVDFKDLYNYDMELAADVLKDPDRILELFSRVVYDKLRQRDLVYAEAQNKIHIRFRALPSVTQLRRIGSEHIGRLVMVQGIIVRASATTPQVMKAVFCCSNCNELNYVEQDGETLKTPIKCEHCDSKTRFDLVPKLSVFMDSQRVTIQERPEDLPPGQLPRSLHVDLKDDVVDQARPGDRITLVGSVDLLQRFGRGGQLRIFDMVMEASHIEVSGRESEMTAISPEDEEKIKEIAQDPWVHRRLIQSIAPSIYGHENIKESILYLLFGGVNKDLPDVRIRGDINVLLVGDPGTGKSQLLQFAAKIAPRGLMTTGRGSTAAGLTAAVVKEGGTGNFVLEAGALVLADQGVCCIDEIDKMREEDRGAIHPAMEQQIVLIAKGGIVATLNARTSILAAGNPTLGRYNPYQTIGQNINLPVTILSRFDVIFVLKDVPDAEKDATMAEHILGLHRTAGSTITSSIDPELFRKYISYAKTRIRPILNEEVITRFRDFYVKMRTASMEGGEASAVAITARQLESLVRLAEARAKAHLRREVTKEDAEAVITLMQSSLEQVGIDVSTGQIDIDIIYTGKPRSLQTQLQKVLGKIAELERTGPVKDDDLYEALAEEGVNRSEAAKLISTLMRDGTIFSPRPGTYRRAS